MIFPAKPTHLLFVFILIGLLSFVVAPLRIYAQLFEPLTSSQILHQMHKASELHSVLYLAAHPDDENTRLISWLVNEKHYRTAYLSLTRGDGGQNLIGSELREKLGIIRTQELLAARRVDGAEQFFTRANDFGYSKHPDETFTVWNKDSILADVVYIIRYFKPDVIITRFPTTPGITHGHHTASAMLAQEAFALASDPKAFPEQLAEVSVWKPTSLYWNTSSWFFRGERAAEYDTTQLISLSVGGYNPLLGQSYPEIASKSRSQHRSQGFGSAIYRDEIIEWLQPVLPVQAASLQEMLMPVRSWKSETSNPTLDTEWANLIREFNVSKPENSVPQILKIREIILQANFASKSYKISQLDKILMACLGLHAELVSASQMVSGGSEVEANAKIILRTPNHSVTVQKIVFTSINQEISINQKLSPYQTFAKLYTLAIPEDVAISQPYWLSKKGTIGMFGMPSRVNLTQAENPAAFYGRLDLIIDKTPISIKLPIRHQRVERSIGEISEPLYVEPAIIVRPKLDLIVALNQKPQVLKVDLTSNVGAAKGSVYLTVPEGWRSVPDKITLNFDAPGSKTVEFKLEPSKAKANSGKIKVNVQAEGGVYDRGYVRLEASHYPPQVFFPPAEIGLTSVDVETKAGRVIYIEGAGDVLPEALASLGYTVDRYGADQINTIYTTGAKAIVFGIRAFNINPDLLNWLPKLEAFVENGGVVLIQYNTAPLNLTFAQDTLTVGRSRVTNEMAEVQSIGRKLQLLNNPNIITEADWNGWVQERGLYFAENWSANWQPIISLKDDGEPAQQGALLVNEHGKGRVVFTGLSLFRQIPAGVAGAYRILANIIESGTTNL